MFLDSVAYRLERKQKQLIAKQKDISSPGFLRNGSKKWILVRYKRRIFEFVLLFPKKGVFPILQIIRSYAIMTKLPRINLLELESDKDFQDLLSAG
jgi:hypothetical protein